ncbi:MAG: DUF3817 domain-containing protein [Bacteroidota bacterium]
MNDFFQSQVGRLRLLAMAEGVSLLVLVFVSVPLKHVFGVAHLSSVLGPIHGILFLVFMINAISVGVAYGWKFKQTTWKVILAAVIPFGTFYIDRKILKPIHQKMRR